MAMKAVTLGLLAATTLLLQRRRWASQRKSAAGRTQLRERSREANSYRAASADGRRRFEGQVVLVTGAGSGIGRATAIKFALEGALVCVNDLPGNDAAIQGTIDEALRVRPGAVLRGFPCDVSNRAGVEAMIESICSSDSSVGFGRIDVVVTNAYFSHRDHFLDLDWAKVHKTFDVTLFGAFHVMQFAGRKMAAQPVLLKQHEDATDELSVRRGTRGVFVIVSSIMSKVPFSLPQSVPYNAAKAALDNMVLTMASDLARHQIRVVGLNPGWIDTAGERQFTSAEEMLSAGRKIPMGLGQPGDVADAALFVASKDATYITGTSLHVDGGFQISHRIPGIHVPIQVPKLP